MIRRRFIALAALLCAFCGRAGADAADDVIQAEMAAGKIPGVAVAVVRDGQPVKLQGYGFANLEHKVPVTPDTVFQLGSVGKQFTAGAVLLTARDGKLSLDDPIKKHLPFAPEAWKPITVKNLLNHTSGIKDYTEFIDVTRNNLAEETGRLMADKPLDFAPGTKWAYSNTNYLLLGVIIERATGKFYGDVLAERVFKPLGMTTARINSDAAIIPNRAAGYDPTPDGLRNQAYVAPNPNTYADGSVVMSLRDMVKWDAALDTDTPFPKAIRDQMWTPGVLKDGKKTQYGYGWFIGEYNGHRVIEHSGGWQGFTAHIARYPDDKLTVIVLTNFAAGRPTRIARAVAGIYIPALKPKDAAPAKTPEQVTQLVRDVVREIAEDKLNLDRFTQEMRDALESQPRDRMAAGIRSLGEIKSVTILDKQTFSGETTYRIRVEFARAKAIVQLSLDPDGKISGLSIKPE